MSHLDELTRRLCPGGVPIEPLGAVGEFIRGNGLQKSDLTEHGTPAIHYGQIHTHYGTWAERTKSYVDPTLAARLRRARPGDLVVATTSEDDDAVAKATAWIGTEEAAVSGDAYIFRHRLEPKYMAYAFQTRQFQDQKVRHITGTKVRRISGEALSKVRIPVPPLEVQREIVRILDTFTELEARRRQFEHYRAGLFSSATGSKPTRLGDLAEFKYGYTATAADTGDYRLIRITDITPSGKLSPVSAKFVTDSDSIRDYVVGPGDLLMARTGATFGKTMMVESDAPAVYASFLIRIRFGKRDVLPAYYWHFAQSNLYWEQANAMVSTGGQPQFNANVLQNVVVPVPPLAEQQRIVTALDKFDALVNDLSIGLPAELAARRKQYEYYRDKLLTFEELPA